MILKFNRRKIETVCIIISLVLIIFMIFSCVLALSDAIFNWNIFPDNLQKIGVLILMSMGIIIFACVIMVTIINLSIISLSLEKISEKYTKDTNEE